METRGSILQIPHRPYILFVFICICVFSNSQAQNTADTLPPKKTSLVKVSGNIYASADFYNTTDTHQRYVPVSPSLTGSLALKVGYWSFPFTFIISEKERKIRQAFNQIGTTGEHKWVKLHTGYRTFSQSSLTLSGMTFLGFAGEINPGLLRFGAMYGRLQRRVAYDSTSEYTIYPAYERWAYTLKAGIGNSKNYFDLIFLQGKDKISSLSDYERGDARPAENEVAGYATRFKLSKRWSFESEGALSMFTRNRLDTGDAESFTDLPFNSNHSTQALSALKAAFTYQGKELSLVTAYKRVEPEYRSMGTYYFQNDVEQLLLTPKLNLKKGLLKMEATAGAERNDLLRLKNSDTRRFIANFRLGWQPTPKYTVDVQFANYGSNIRYKDFMTAPDVTQNQLLFYCNNRYLISNNNYMHTIFGNLAHQRIDFNETQNPANSRYSSVNLSYTLSFLQKDMTLNSSLGYTSSKLSTYDIGTVNVNVGGQKTLLDSKLQTGFSANYQPSFRSGEQTGFFYMINATAAYTASEKHIFTADLSYQRQKDSTGNSLLANGRELRAILGYRRIF